MDIKLFNEFLSSNDTLRVYRGEKLIFSSKKNMLAPLIEYIDSGKNGGNDTVIMDKMVGNAAALLAVFAGGREVMSPVGSEIAVKTLDHYGLKYQLVTIVPQVKAPAGGNWPMEELSRGKEPEEFYRIMKKMMQGGGRPPAN